MDFFTGAQEGLAPDKEYSPSRHCGHQAHIRISHQIIHAIDRRLDYCKKTILFTAKISAGPQTSPPGSFASIRALKRYEAPFAETSATQGFRCDDA
jgi:hypothetical protein